MARSLFERFVLIVFVAGCIILCCSGKDRSWEIKYFSCMMARPKYLVNWVCFPTE